MPIGSLMTEITLAVVATIAASALAGVYFMSLGQASDIQRLQIAGMKEQLSYSCKIIYVHGRTGSNIIKLWIKNIGYKDIQESLIKRSELILASRSQAYYLLHGTSPPSWSYQLRNDADEDGRWDPSETIEITATLDEPLPRDDYTVKFTLFTGAECSYPFSS